MSQHSGNTAPHPGLSSPFLPPCSLTPASWGHFPNALLAPKSFSQAVPLGAAYTVTGME